VRQLLDGDQRLARVMPRYKLDDGRDWVAYCSDELDDGLPHDDCEYFAVYVSCDPFSFSPFSESALANHQVIPFD
jgi:hypothetical protein